MQRHHAGAESAPEALDQLRRERDFRHQHQGLAAAGDRRGDDSQVNLGFAAAGDAVSRCAAKLDSVATMASTPSACAAVRVTSLGAHFEGDVSDPAAPSGKRSAMTHPRFARLRR